MQRFKQLIRKACGHSSVNPGPWENDRAGSKAQGLSELQIKHKAILSSRVRTGPGVKLTCPEVVQHEEDPSFHLQHYNQIIHEVNLDSQAHTVGLDKPGTPSLCSSGWHQTCDPPAPHPDGCRIGMERLGLILKECSGKLPTLLA